VARADTGRHRASRAPSLLQLAQHGAAIFPSFRRSRELHAALEVRAGELGLAQASRDPRACRERVLEAAALWRFGFQCARKRVERGGELALALVGDAQTIATD